MSKTKATKRIKVECKDVESFMIDEPYDDVLSQLLERVSRYIDKGILNKIISFIYCLGHKDISYISNAYEFYKEQEKEMFEKGLNDTVLRTIGMMFVSEYLTFVENKD